MKISNIDQVQRAICKYWFEAGGLVGTIDVGRTRIEALGSEYHAEPARAWRFGNI